VHAVQGLHVLQPVAARPICARLEDQGWEDVFETCRGMLKESIGIEMRCKGVIRNVQVY